MRPARVAGLALAGAWAAAAAAGRATAAPASSEEIAAVAHDAERKLDEWRFADGRARVADLERLAPGAAPTHYLEGYEHFLEGDYEDAIHQLDAALATDPHDRNAENARELRVLATAARDAVKDYREERSGHFIIRYPAVDAVLVPYAREALEAAYSALHDDLGFDAELPVRVEFYRSPSDLAAVSSLSEAEVARTGTIALCKWARLMVTSPRALATGYPWLDTINHEFVHYAVSTITHDRAPVWLQEGLAKFLERRWREPAGGRIPPAMESLLAKALRSGKLITFEAMHPSMAKLPTAEDATLAFAEVANAVGYLYAQAGTKGLRAALAAVAAGTDAREAVAAAAGVTWPEFERGWRAYMVAQKYRTFPAIDLPTTHVRKANAIASARKPSEDEGAVGVGEDVAAAFASCASATCSCAATGRAPPPSSTKKAPRPPGPRAARAATRRRRGSSPSSSGAPTSSSGSPSARSRRSRPSRRSIPICRGRTSSRARRCSRRASPPRRSPSSTSRSRPTPSIPRCTARSATPTPRRRPASGVARLTRSSRASASSAKSSGRARNDRARGRARRHRTSRAPTSPSRALAYRQAASGCPPPTARANAPHAAPCAGRRRRRA